VSQRQDGAVNPKLPTGEIEIYADEIELLNAVRKQLPFQVSTAEAESVKEELRLRYRYLDLRRERMAQNLQVRHAVVKAIRRFLEDEEHFMEVETPILTRSTRRARAILSCRLGSMRGMVCPAAVAAVIQANLDGIGGRSLLPDCPLFPR
jgi:aspartyl-tRNA synthetase